MSFFLQSFLSSFRSQHSVFPLHSLIARIHRICNLVPRAFPLKNGWGGEKPWGRGCRIWIALSMSPYVREFRNLGNSSLRESELRKIFACGIRNPTNNWNPESKSHPASFPVVLGDFALGSKPPLVTRIARTGLGTRLSPTVKESGIQNLNPPWWRGKNTYINIFYFPRLFS